MSQALLNVVSLLMEENRKKEKDEVQQLKNEVGEIKELLGLIMI